MDQYHLSGGELTSLLHVLLHLTKLEVLLLKDNTIEDFQQVAIALSIDKLGNPGNFLALLKLLAVYDDDLRSHLEAPSMRCATQVSPLTQSELIKVMGKHVILQGILDDLNSTRFYAILADEVTSHNTEHLAI